MAAAKQLDMASAKQGGSSVDLPETSSPSPPRPHPPLPPRLPLRITRNAPRPSLKVLDHLDVISTYNEHLTICQIGDTLGGQCHTSAPSAITCPLPRCLLGLGDCGPLQHLHLQGQCHATWGCSPSGSKVPSTTTLAPIY